MRAALAAMAVAAACAGGATAQPYDAIIRNGTIVDGTGSARYLADVGVRHGHIARVGGLKGETAPVEIDATGLFVAPGFINIHDHPEFDAVFKSENLLTQGVTTEIGNPDGSGSTDLIAQAKAMSHRGLATNLGLYIGFNAVWAEVMGRSDRRPDDGEIERMRGLVSRALEAGAWGVSAGLDYKPAYFAHTDEVIRVVSAAQGWRTNFPNHERLTPEAGYSGLTGARETIEIGVKSGIAPVFTHMKAQGSEQYRAGEILDLMDKATRAGHYVAGDIYPYTFGFNNVRTLLIPAWALDGGEDALYARFQDPAARARMTTDIETVMAQRWNGPAGVYVSGLKRELTDLMADWGVSAGEAIIRLNEQHRGRLPTTYLRFGVEEDMIRMLRHPSFAVACDCGALLKVSGHPRAFGTFPRVLGRYVRDMGVLTWEEAIHKMSGLPASIVGLVDRGLIAPGMAADIVVFDPRTITDRGTDDAPQLAEGVRHVLVNGQVALRDGIVTGGQGGVLLKRSANMPTRPFVVGSPRRIKGAVDLKGGESQGLRVALDLVQRTGDRTARGRIVVSDSKGAQVFAARQLGVVQSGPHWTTVTGDAILANGEARAFTLILDGGKSDPAQGRAIVLEVDGGPTMEGSDLGRLKLGR